MKPELKKFLYGISAILGFLFFCVVFLMLSSRGYFVDRGIPVAKEDVVWLCRELDAIDDPICSNDKEVYPEDFSSLIERKFENGKFTYQQVQITLGKFQMSMQEEEKFNFFVVSYDLNGDDEFDIWMMFDGTIDENYLESDAILFREEVGF